MTANVNHLWIALKALSGEADESSIATLDTLSYVADEKNQFALALQLGPLPFHRRELLRKSNVVRKLPKHQDAYFDYYVSDFMTDRLRAYLRAGLKDLHEKRRRCATAEESMFVEFNRVKGA